MEKFLACVLIGGFVALPLDLSLGLTCIGFVMAIIAVFGRVM